MTRRGPKLKQGQLGPVRHQRPTLSKLAPFGALVPILVLLGALYIYPTARMFYLSFVTGSLGLSNYSRFFQTGVYVHVLIFTILMAVATTVCCLGIGYPVAYALAIAPGRIRALLFFVVLMPWLVPELVRN